MLTVIAVCASLPRVFLCLFAICVYICTCHLYLCATCFCATLLPVSVCHMSIFYMPYVGLARTIYIRFIYGISGREITKYMVIYGVFIYLYGSGQP